MIGADRSTSSVELTGHIRQGTIAGAGRISTSPVQISLHRLPGHHRTWTADELCAEPDDWADPAGSAEAKFMWRKSGYSIARIIFRVSNPPGDAPMVGPLPAKLAGM